jgi:hypothetical protein
MEGTRVEDAMNRSVSILSVVLALTGKAIGGEEPVRWDVPGHYNQPSFSPDGRRVSKRRAPFYWQK